MTDIQAQAHAILISLVETPFDQCFEVSRKFEGLPNLAGLYVVRHRNNGILYLGKTNRLNNRFAGGHKALVWAWLDLYPPSDIRIAIAPLDRWMGATVLSELERILLRATEPPYNAQIPMED
jgi:hypothetical protein